MGLVRPIAASPDRCHAVRRACRSDLVGLASAIRPLLLRLIPTRLPFSMCANSRFAPAFRHGVLVPGMLSLVAVMGACKPKTVLLTVTPSTTRVYGTTPRGDSLLGRGQATVTLKKEGTRITLNADGYRPVSRVLTTADAQSGELRLALTAWRFQINVDPFDAESRVDGVVQPSRSFVLEVERDKARTLEITKPGFRRIVKRYENLDGTQPPAIERFQLTDRAVLLTVAPAGTTIEVAGKPIGENAAEIAIPPGQCTAVRVVRPGYLPVEKQYCEGAAFAALPLTDKIELRDRMVALTAEPATADIFVGGRKVSTGQFNVAIRTGTCTEVRLEAPAFSTQRREYCNQDNAQPIPFEDLVKLGRDEAWDLSMASDQANVNFTIEVGNQRAADDAWKTISQIVTNSFDVLEVTDKETGYLRTGWNVRRFSDKVIRTRVIVKLADANPLKYTIKLASEKSDDGRATVKDDELFREWDRVLLQYKDLINEVQSRLR